jgi:UDP-N-acetyl-D-mannosaminuronic acid dehydrogenase
MSGRTPPIYDADRSPERLRAQLTGGELPVAVYGLGKMGLPLAGVYAETTGNVTGVDVDPSVVERVNAGESHVLGEPGLSDLVAEQVSRGRLAATTDGSMAAADARIHVIIVPTLLTEADEPDLTTVESVVEDIAAGLEPGDLVVAESTLPPGSCRDILLPHLCQESGLGRGEFGLAFCPERTASGTALRDIRGEYPKVVGGVDAESTRAAELVYDELSSNEIHPVSDATTAEAVKVFEGVYRDVNIALANELGRLADELEISVREAIDTANGLSVCQLHEPGPGVGGHCIPYYPHFLLATMDEPMPVMRTARELNDAMPTVMVDRLADQLAAVDTDLADASVLVCGITYRAGVEETRASPAIGVIDALEAAGADVAAVDPLVDPAAFGARPVTVSALPEESFDGAIVVTPHAEFEAIAWAELEPMVVVDGRDALDLSGTAHRQYTFAGSRDGSMPVVGDERGRDASRLPDEMPEPRRTDGGNDV